LIRWISEEQCLLTIKQADLLGRICAGPLRHADELRAAGAFAHEEKKAAPTKGKSKSKV
jgi:hypothetical protein